MNELIHAPARRLARLLERREVSPVELMRAFIERIEAVNPKLNAIVTFLPERALDAAHALERSGARAGPLAGLPIAYKDLVPTRGVRTTYGSPIYADHVPEEDHLLVERLGAAGAILIGKTNTPEFGAGSQTFNKVFGVTRNPYDTSKTSGGSSGGAAAAVASGMLPFADGSDLAASLRNPASYCNLVGFRPTPGRVPNWPAANAWETLSVLGPITRTVEDCAFLMSAMAGPDPRVPSALTDPGGIFAQPLEREFKGARVAWSPDLGGLPVDRSVREALEVQKKSFETLGCRIEEAEPDFDGATESFEVLRALGFLLRYGGLLKSQRDKLKDTVIWNIEEGLKLTPQRIVHAEALRTQLFHRMRTFLERYEFLLCPACQLAPFPVEVEWPREIAGVPMENYLDWMKSCYYITITSHPAISVPAGFTPQGLPIGLQIVGRYREDFAVLQLAHAFESLTGVWKRTSTIG